MVSAIERKELVDDRIKGCATIVLSKYLGNRSLSGFRLVFSLMASRLLNIKIMREFRTVKQPE